MNVLVIGGSGIVGSLVMPQMAQAHRVRVFDLCAPQDTSLDYVQGNLTEYESLAAAMTGMDALIYLAMGNLSWQDISGAVTAYDVNVKGVYLALRAAHSAGITQAVYASSMSVYAGILEARYFADEDVIPDSSNIYGFTKRLGELVCHNAAREWGMNINALRLCRPTPEDRWLAETVTGTPTIATTGPDVARAFLAALDYGAGFQAFMISGDYEQRIMNMSKARRLLNWEPLARPVRQPEH